MKYTVWVGGIEVNSHYLNKAEAEQIAEVWKYKGYADVAVQEITHD